MMLAVLQLAHPYSRINSASGSLTASGGSMKDASSPYANTIFLCSHTQSTPIVEGTKGGGAEGGGAKGFTIFYLFPVFQSHSTWLLSSIVDCNMVMVYTCVHVVQCCFVVLVRFGL